MSILIAVCYSILPDYSLVAIPLGITTPELNGFTSFIQLKHYSERGLTTTEQRIESDLVASQGGVRDKQGPFKVGLGAVETLYVAVAMAKCFTA